jgi:hypothetical protein
MAAMKPTVPEVLPLARAVYAKPLGGAGCCLHIVLDEGNVDDRSVDFCLDYARRKGHDDCARLAEILRSMSKTQRLKIGALAPSV